jgi:ribosomal protein S18 acetylase RimI-like enzyme
MNAVASAPALVFSRSYLWDLFGVRSLENVCFENDAYDIVSILELLLSPKMRCLKASQGGHMLGFVAGEIDRGKDVGWIVTLGVHPNAIGQGIGSRLLLDCEQLMAMSTVKLTVRKSNSRAIALYERHGYKYEQTIARYYNDGEDGLLMTKRIR